MMHPQRINASMIGRVAFVALAALLPITATVLGTPAVLADARTAADPILMPHRAVYDLRLARSHGRVNIASAQGRLVYEIDGSACLGWTVNMRMVNKFVTRDGTEGLIDSRNSSWEAADGSEMQFSASNMVNGMLDREFTGAATRGDRDMPGEVVINGDDEVRFVLSSEAVFPTEHSVRLIEAARAGLTRDRTVVYDSDKDGNTYTAVSFIGGEVTADLSAIEDGDVVEQVLTGAVAWPISIAYYKDSDEEGLSGEPSHQVHLVMLDNGIASELSLEYEDFTLDGRLVSLRVMDKDDCSG